MLPLHSTASRAEIERRAKKIFHAKGRPAGRDLEHWLEAEGDFMLSVALRNGAYLINTNRGNIKEEFGLEDATSLIRFAVRWGESEKPTA